MKHSSDYLSDEFADAKAKALRFIESWNDRLPTEACPTCQSSGHVPGLPCPECYHVYPISWSLLLDTEWGYSVVALNNRRHVLANFNIEEP